MHEKKQNTNLAAEYYILSMLYRRGISAFLTVGNKKAVDIIVNVKGVVYTIDVKGLDSQSCFPVDNCTLKAKTHYFVFVCFRGEMRDPKCLPEIYVVPSFEMNKRHVELGGESIVYKSPRGNRTAVRVARLRKLSSLYLDNWAELEKE